MSKIDPLHIYDDSGPRCWETNKDHEYCEPGCSREAHCWRCLAQLPQTPEWDEWWIDDDGVSRLVWRLICDLDHEHKNKTQGGDCYVYDEKIEAL